MEFAKTDTSFLKVLGSFLKKAFFLAIITSFIILIVPFLLTTLNGINIIPSCQNIVFLVLLFL